MSGNFSHTPAMQSRKDVVLALVGRFCLIQSMLRIRPIIALTLLLSISSFAQTLPLLPRTTNAISTADFIRQIKPLPLTDREQAIASEILHGNVPSRLRDLHPLDITNVSYGKTNGATIFVTRDYLSIGRPHGSIKGISRAERFSASLASAARSKNESMRSQNRGRMETNLG